MTELLVTERPKRQPTHPGEVLREDILPALRMTVSHAARALGVSRQPLHAVMAGEQRVSVEMALHLAKFCGNSPEMWPAMQAARDRWQSARTLAPELARIPTPKPS